MDELKYFKKYCENKTFCRNFQTLCKVQIQKKYQIGKGGLDVKLSLA